MYPKALSWSLHLSFPISNPVAALELSPVLIVEDHVAVQRRLAHILGALGVPAERIGYAADIAGAKQAMRESRFASALVDVGLPDGSGIDLIPYLHERAPDTLAVVISSFGTQDLILRALHSGAVGYLLKEREDVEIAAALRSIQHGGAPIDPFVAKHILRLVAAPAASPPSSVAADAPGEMAGQLTRREEEILTLVAQGLVTREIAERLSRSPLTIDGHVKSILRKLQVNTRTKAINQARALGWL